MSLSSSKTRVVITGMGAICGMGHNVDEVWQSALEGKSGISELSDDAFPIRAFGEVKNFTLSEEIMPLREQSHFDRFTLLGLHAAEESLRQSGLSRESIEKIGLEEVGCIFGVGMGGFPVMEEMAHIARTKGPRRVSPFFVPAVIPNILTGLLSIKYGFLGTNYSIASACASSGHAMMNAYDLIRAGRHKVMITGGAEAAHCLTSVGGFNNMKALSKSPQGVEKASRPFDVSRDGFVMGEGAGILVFEDYEHAKARGATILGEVVGFGSSSDANHITAPHPEGLGARVSMKRALKDAGIEAKDIQLINAHATSTPLGDQLEAKAISDLFGNEREDLWVTATKSMSGHLLGGAAALESIFCLKGLQEQVMAPTINLEEQDPNCPIRVVKDKAKKANLTYVLNNVFGFGGTNSSVIFKKV